MQVGLKMKNRCLVYLSYLVLVTMITTMVSFARYATTNTAINTVSVARPVLAYVPISAERNGTPITELTGGIAVANSEPGDVIEYVFEIRNYDGVNRNQVMMKYKPTVTFNPPAPGKLLPLSYTLEANGSYPDAGSGWTYLGYDGDITHSYTLTLTWPAASADPAFRSKVQSINIQIDSQQTD